MNRREKVAELFRSAPTSSPPDPPHNSISYDMARKGGGGAFGLTSSGRGRGGFRGGYRGNTFRGRGRGRGAAAAASAPVPTKDEDGTQLAERFEKVKVNDEVDEKLGFPRIQEGGKREGWLVNMHPVRLTCCWSLRQITNVQKRPYFAIQTIPRDGRRSTSTSSRMTGSCSKPHSNTSHTSALRARCADLFRGSN